LAEKGIITLQIGIHGIPVTLDQNVYDSLANGALNRYMVYGLENKNDYYYRRVILGALRANDFLMSLPQFDGANLAVMGGSQGGALSIMTAALDSRVKALAVWVPALADLTGYIYGRAGGWHHAFKSPENRTKEKIETSKYYDTVNFARRLKVPGIYTFGYNDETCPPTSMYAAYNTITASKDLLLALETGHSLTNEQSERINSWIENKLKENTKK
jgi:cephalosporin-C deacetylase-like acetyl esterase